MRELAQQNVTQQAQFVHSAFSDYCMPFTEPAHGTKMQFGNVLSTVAISFDASAHHEVARCAAIMSN